jgi:hypothetical protein
MGGRGADPHKTKFFSLDNLFLALNMDIPCTSYIFAIILIFQDTAGWRLCLMEEQWPAVQLHQQVRQLKRRVSKEIP